MAVSSGYGHTCATHMYQNTVCWGFNKYGQLSVPIALTLDTVTQLSIGYRFMCTINGYNSLLCNGDNYHGQVDIESIQYNDSIEPIET